MAESAKRVFAAAAIALSAACISTGARSEVLARYQANAWAIEANASGGQFQNCTMSLASAHAAKVVLSLNRDGRWAIGVMNPALNLTPGASAGRVAYWVDDVVPRGGTATAIDASTLMVPVENSAQLFEEMRLGSMVNVKVGNETLTFSTNGSSAAVATVTNCMRRHAQQAQSPR